MKRIFIKILLVGLFLVGTSCEDFLDINTDPNFPATVPVTQLLPSVEVTMTAALGMSTGGLSNITSTYMHHLVQRGVNTNDYAFDGATYGVLTPWNTIFRTTLTDIDELKEQARVQENAHYLGIAQILEAYIYSILVDLWGDVPYTNANQGAANPTPDFESGAAVYDSVFVQIDRGIANLSNASDISPSTDDVIYGGDLENWERFANSLKLKLLNQVRLVRDVSGEVNSLINSGMLISDASQDFELDYFSSSAPDNRNLGYAQEWAPGGQFYYVSPYLYEMMQGTRTFFASNILEGIQDPRVPYYWYNQVAPELGETPENPTAYFDGASGFLSIYTFSFNIDPNEGFDQSSSQSVLGLYPIGGRYDEGQGLTSNFNGYGQSPQRMLTHYAILYTRAELALVGESSEDDADLFEQAMRASFAKVNEIASDAGAPQITASQINRYVTSVMGTYNGGSDEEKLQLIMTEKWIATVGFGVDAYTDYRRTGYPILHDGNTDILSVTVQGREFPVAFPYPVADLTLLPNQGQRNVYLDRVFWDN